MSASVSVNSNAYTLHDNVLYKFSCFVAYSQELLLIIILATKGEEIMYLLGYVIMLERCERKGGCVITCMIISYTDLSARQVSMNKD